MTGAGVIQQALGGSQWLLNTFLADFSDDDLFVRPVPSANHAAWQLGHLINSEQSLLKMIPKATPIDLGAGWAEKYTAESSRVDPPTGYLTKAEYLDAYKRSRANVRR